MRPLLSIVKDSGLGNLSKIQLFFDMRHTFEVSGCLNRFLVEWLIIITPPVNISAVQSGGGGAVRGCWLTAVCRLWLPVGLQPRVAARVQCGRGNCGRGMALRCADSAAAVLYHGKKHDILKTLISKRFP